MNGWNLNPHIKIKVYLSVNPLSAIIYQILQRTYHSTNGILVGTQWIDIISVD